MPEVPQTPQHHPPQIIHHHQPIHHVPRKSRPSMHHNSSNNSSTIVVSDTKRLVEIAASSKSTSSGKKEPTLVIIDTNSILSGHGPIPISQKPPQMPPMAHQHHHHPHPQSAYAMSLPMALPAQGVYPANMRATITPIPMVHHPPPVAPPPPKPAPPPPPQAPQVLPTLTDDMYVVEAPSFIVPYVYEKPPLKEFKKFVENIGKEVEEARKV